MLNIEIIKFEAQDVITASNACVCDPLDCYWDPDYNYQVISHSNGCTAPDHSCNPGRPE